MDASAFAYEVKSLRQDQKALDEGHVQQAITLTAHEQRITNLEKNIERVLDTLNKGVWALVGFAFTVAASAMGIAISMAGG